jgi:2-keto-4-pentenoate hydratase
MDSTTFEAARADLMRARRDARAIADWPVDRRPADLAEAYRLQAAVASRLGEVVGWKVAAVTEGQRQALGVDRPVGAPLLRRWMHDTRSSPATLRLADFIAPRLECEFAFELSRDLPPRPESNYTRAEVAAAVGALRLGVEIVDWRVPRGLGALTELADGFNNGAYIAGPAIVAWSDIDLGATGIVLRRTHESRSEDVADGSGRAILDGDPFATVVMLANAPPDARRGLAAGDIVTTGSCTGAPLVPGEGRYRAEFARLGSVEFVFDR